MKIGNQYNFEYWIKDHLGNVRVTFSDNNGNGLLVGDEIRSRNDYYPFGDQACSRHRDVSWAKGNVAIAPQVQRGAISEVKTLCSGQSAFAEKEWNNRWELSDTISPLNLKRFNGKELIEDMNLNQLIFGARILDIETGRWISPEPLVDEHTNISPYNYALNNPIRFVDPDGRKIEDIIIRGTKDDKGDAFRKATFDALQSLTNDKLQFNKDGSISIVERGTGSLAHGTELIRGLVDGKTAAGKDFDVVLTNDARGVKYNNKLLDLKTNALTKPIIDSNAGNGLGTGSNVYIGVELNSHVTMQDGSNSKVPYNIALGHELIHADRNSKGIRQISPLLPKPFGNTEELKTIKQENNLRLEHGLNLRYTGNF